VTYDNNNKNRCKFNFFPGNGIDFDDNQVVATLDTSYQYTGESQATMKRAPSSRHAFTLIEIIIVILIIGILLGIAVPNFARAREAASAKSCISNMKTLNAANLQRMMDLKLSSGSPTVSVSQLVSAGYLKSTPTCPSGGNYMNITNGYEGFVCTTFMGGPTDPTSHFWAPDGTPF
jgi:prepilin-type N-terminal cleavage/methylation domain-containing protein